VRYGPYSHILSQMFPADWLIDTHPEWWTRGQFSSPCPHYGNIIHHLAGVVWWGATGLWRYVCSWARGV